MRVWLLLFAAFAIAHAAEFAYTIPAPHGSHVEAPVFTRTAGWEVTVSYDQDRCEILCVYKLRNGRLPVFLPPAVSIRIFAGMRVSTVVLDPAHTRDRSLLPLDRLEDPDEAAPASEIHRTPLESAGIVERASESVRPAAIARVQTGSLPLRI